MLDALKNSHDFKKLNPSLDNIREALALFSDPHANYDSVIIAGTNGKGSVVNLLEKFFLLYTDLRIGKFTSPHLVSVTERIQINDQEISEKALDILLKQIDSKLDFELSYFEKLSLASFLYFSEEKLDLAIIEVGMGGRWDCANVIPDERRLATAITSISLDHTEYLGDTAEKIRVEKEAIKRESVPHFDYLDYDADLEVMDRNYELALDIFKSIYRKDFEPDREKIMQAFYSGYKARFQELEEYNALLDSAHNPEAALALVNHLKLKYPQEKDFDLHLAFMDKDYMGFVKVFYEQFPNITIKLHQLHEDRATDAKLAYNKIKEEFPGLDIELSNDIDLKSENFKVFTGSIYFCGELLKTIG